MSNQGTRPLSYRGTRAGSPVNTTFSNLRPTPYDKSDAIYSINDEWVYTDPATLTSSDPNVEIWKLVSLNGDETSKGSLAHWVQLTNQAGNDIHFDCNQGFAIPIQLNADGFLTLNTLGGANITTSALVGTPNTVTVNLNDSVTLPGNFTVSSLGAGNVTTDVNGLFHSSLGTNNQFLMTYGGEAIWANITAGDGSIAIVPSATGISLTAPGGGGGGAGTFTTDLFAPATVSGSTIGTLGDGTTIITSATGVGKHVVTIGVKDSAVTGQLLISGGTGTAGGALWASLSSSDGSVTITPGVNTINLQASGGGGGGTTSYVTNSGTATNNAGVITMVGDGTLLSSKATGAGNHTVEYDIVNGTKGQVMMSGTTLATWGTLAAGSNVTIDTSVSGTITIASSGGAGGITLFPTDHGNATPTAGKLFIYGQTGNSTGGAYNNITTYKGTSVTANDTVFIDLTQWVTLPATNLGATSGGISIAGADDNATFLHTYGTATNWSNINTFVGPRAGGTNSGTCTPLTVGTAINNTGIGGNVLNGITTGNHLTAVGYNSSTHMTTASYCTALGAGSLGNAATTTGATAVGYHALNAYNSASSATAVGYNTLSNATASNCAFGSGTGLTLTTGIGNLLIGDSVDASATSTYNIYIGNSAVTPGVESYTTRIGSTTGAHQIQANYQAGIYGRTYSPGANGVMMIDSSSKLGHNQTNGGGFTPGTVLMGRTSTGAYWGDLSAGGGIKVDHSTPGDIKISSTVKNVSSFLYIQETNVVNASGDNTIYWLGTGATLTKVYDQLSDVYAGLGNVFYTPGSSTGKAYFTAPVDGMYFFQLSCIMTNLLSASAPSPVVNSSSPIRITTSNRAYALINEPYAYQGAVGVPGDGTKGCQSWFMTCYADMQAGDTADFSCNLKFPLTSPSRSIGVGLCSDSQGAYYTFFSGFMVSTGLAT